MKSHLLLWLLTVIVCGILGFSAVSLLFPPGNVIFLLAIVLMMWTFGFLWFCLKFGTFTHSVMHWKIAEVVCSLSLYNVIGGNLFCYFDWLFWLWFVNYYESVWFIILLLCFSCLTQNCYLSKKYIGRVLLWTVRFTLLLYIINSPIVILFWHLGRRRWRWVSCGTSCWFWSANDVYISRQKSVP